MSLHDDIMNIQIPDHVENSSNDNYRIQWKLGHKYALHAAAELALGETLTCARCNGQGVDPDPEPVCCGKGTVHGCCGEPEPDFGPCRDCAGTGSYGEQGGEWVRLSESQSDAINHALDVLSKHGDAFTTVEAMRVLEEMLSPPTEREDGHE